MNNREEMSEGMTPKLPLWSYQVQSDSKLAVRTRKDLEIHLITRALKDEGFKQEFLANPKGVVEKELGTKLPEELEINVLEETENTLYMVLPCNPYEGMSEEELKVALGMTYEDVAQWVLEQQRNAFLDETSSIALIARIWRDEKFKQELLRDPKGLMEREISLTLLTDGVEIKVLVENTHTIYTVLPDRANVGGILPVSIAALALINVGCSPDPGTYCDVTASAADYPRDCACDVDTEDHVEPPCDTYDPEGPAYTNSSVCPRPR
jgi:hypothetical protein